MDRVRRKYCRFYPLRYGVEHSPAAIFSKDFGCPAIPFSRALSMSFVEGSTPYREPSS